MARVCLNCGKKIGMFAEAPLELCDGQVLCDDCSGPIRLKMGKLYSVKYSEEFDILKNEILHECEKIYESPVQKAVENKIDDVYEHNVKVQIKEYQSKPESKRLEDENRIALKGLAKSQLLTTGYDFSGYKITQYIGIISGEVVLGTGFLSEFSASVSDLFGSQSGAFEEKLDTAKKAAIEKLTMKSAREGGNAIIGIDFDYITFSNNMIGVVANGTSVVIEKVE